MVFSISPATLGERIKQVRLSRAMTQQQLAGEDYSKSYISAIEQGRTRPSLDALHRLAARLEVPVGQLLDPNAQGFAPADPTAVPQPARRRGPRAGVVGAIAFDTARQDFQIARAELLIYAGEPDQALAILQSLLNGSTDAGGKQGGPGTKPEPGAYSLDSRQLQRTYYLATRASVRVNKTQEALGYVQQGMELARRTGDREALEQLRLLLGLIHYKAGEPLSALEQHRICLDVAQAGVVKDYGFKLKTFSYMAEEYLALSEGDMALETYRLAEGLMGDASTIQRQAELLRDITAAYGGEKQYVAANQAANKAINIYEALENVQTVARMESRYGNILTEAGDTQEARQHLLHSLELAESLSSLALKAAALTNLARLALRDGDLEQANDLAKRAVQTGRTGANEILASALALAGEIAAQQGSVTDTDEAFNEAIRLLAAREEAGDRESADSAATIYRRYARVLASRGQHEQALSYVERAYDLLSGRRP